MRWSSRWSWPVLLLISTLITALTAGPLPAQTPGSLVANPKSLTEPHDATDLYNSLRDVINYGAELFNKQADHAGCYRVYQGSLIAIRPFLAPEIRKKIDETIIRAESLPYYSERAFELRRVLDEIRNKATPGKTAPKVAAPSTTPPNPSVTPAGPAVTPPVVNVPPSRTQSNVPKTVITPRSDLPKITDSTKPGNPPAPAPFTAPTIEVPPFETKNTERPKIEAPKIDLPSTTKPMEPRFNDLPKPSAPKIEPPKIEVPKIEVPKIEAPKIEAPKIESPKIEAPKKIEPPKIEVPKIEVPKIDEKKPEAPKTDKKGDLPQGVPSLMDLPKDPPLPIPPPLETPKEKKPSAPKVESPMIELPKVTPPLMDLPKDPPLPIPPPLEAPKENKTKAPPPLMDLPIAPPFELPKEKREKIEPSPLPEPGKITPPSSPSAPSDSKPTKIEKGMVSGTILLDGKPLPAGYFVTLVSTDNDKKRLGTVVQQDGVFQFTTGVALGTYKVAIEPLPGDDAKLVPIPSRYCSEATSGLILQVNAANVTPLLRLTR